MTASRGRQANQVTVTRMIPAPASAIFDLLVDPARHAELDGSGHIKQSRPAPGQPGPGRLKLGDTFGMSMKRGRFAYTTRNVVVELTDDRAIAWRTLGPPMVTPFVTGRIWRYQLAPAEGGTVVSETWDISTEAALARPAVRRFLTKETRASMTRTLARIEEILAR
ncbi:MAG: SRPBCC family protein [Nocardioides sp.]